MNEEFRMSVIVSPLSGYPPEPTKRYTVEEYRVLLQTGTLTEDDPYELLEGWLLPMMTIGPEHGVVADILRCRIDEHLTSPWLVRPTTAISLADSMPQPDVLVVRGPVEQYRHRYAVAEDIALVVEVSDTSLARDRGFKQRIYARAGIEQYWIVNLVDRQIEVHTEPQSDSESPIYAQRATYGPGQSAVVRLADVPVFEIAVSELLPPSQAEQ
jgi:Uma2 family endonuclease